MRKLTERKQRQLKLEVGPWPSGIAHAWRIRGRTFEARPQDRVPGWHPPVCPEKPDAGLAEALLRAGCRELRRSAGTGPRPVLT